MNITAKKALEKLLCSAENVAGKSATDSNNSFARTIQVRFNQSSFPDYLGIVTHAEKTSCNAALRLAERDGAISIKWDTRAGNFERIEHIRLVDGNTLATVLGVTPRWDTTNAAAMAFAPYLNTHPVLSNILDTWRKGAPVRTTRPSKEAIQDWLDAIRVVNACRETSKDNQTDTPIKRLSIALFSDSKRIEGISHLIDVLTQGKTTGLPRNEEEIFQEMGLVKFPPTLLMAASQGECNRVIVQLADASVSVAAPYLGFPPQAVVAVNLPQKSMTVLTVENLTTFHETAEYLQCVLKSSSPILLMYTGGMPSPSWRRVYRKALSSLTEESAVWHWGDIDAGGFRIANKLAEDCNQCGHVLRLHLMNVAPTSSRKSLSDAEISVITAICARHKWGAEAQSVEAHRSAIEQESIPVQLPTTSRVFHCR
ncbi:Wadjet anti-phage system protein JetD domain-containing protein [Undibacterium luofuense]|uniref:Wadjet protein JetD C-terminal domain-containing protein n=1 Tax=Undibacterium luofuense TaxID=2828733 RepID=A0A941I675_9BURK|nr:Wadjet anti-phage system protein JetD domain-containing protein [Undibacterium luofuense]MBR7780623.1 hypothetical protein [Undibacterium luofuense]